MGTSSYPQQFYEYLDYSFADGTGVTYDPVVDGDVGDIDFSSPITSITFDYTSQAAFDATFDSPSGNETEEFPIGDGTETVDFPGDVTGIFWVENPASFGWAGITSLSYTRWAVETPEPSTLLLAALGLALVGVAFAWRAARDSAI